MHTGRSPLVAALLVLMVAPAAAQEARPPAPADLIVVNAIVHTADAARPRAQAFAVRDGRVVFVGSTREAEALAGPATERLDLGGRTVIPGMVDAHGHLTGLGDALETVDLVGTRSYDEVIARVVERARGAPKGEWIRGRGWDQNDWSDTRMPSHEALSRAVPDHPVLLERVDGHATLVNAAAMRQAEISRETADPAGGRILKDASGEPTGVLIDNAGALAWAHVPDGTREQLERSITKAIAELHRYGLTGIHDAGVGPAAIEAYESLARAGKFQLRDYVMVSGDSGSLAVAFRRGPQTALHGGRIWVRAIKLLSDGALGSRGAALLDPYSDDAENRGLVLTEADELDRIAADALRTGFQLNVHAIGDRANRMVLDAFEKALTARPTADHRFRVEHAQILNFADIPRFAELGVIPSMQGSHQTSDMYWVPERLGYARALGAYAWRSLLQTGVVVPNGSDFPVESPNPLISFHAFVTRQDAAGFPAGGWMPAQRTSREEALLSMTLWPAYAAFMEQETGSITPGKYADFVVLDRDIMSVPAEQILGTKVLRTVLGGETVYERD
jgi:predicted amidohydrolase YtcJ